MASIQGIEGMSVDQLNFELQRGAKFVVYLYTISVIVVTFKRSSDIFFMKPEQSAVAKGLGYTFLTLLLGWWGIPWGPIYTIQSVWTNFGGGKDVTQDVLAALNAAPPSAAATAAAG